MELLEKAAARLFDTGSVSVAVPEKPFWLSRGRLSAIRIRPGMMLGGEEVWQSAAALADIALDSPVMAWRILNEFCGRVLGESSSYACIISCIEQAVKDGFGDAFDYIACYSDGTFAFSLPAANRLGVPCLILDEESSGVVCSSEKSRRAEELGGARVLVMSGLVAGGNRVIRQMLPAVSRMGGTAAGVFSIIDRRLGGSEMIIGAGIRFCSIWGIDGGFFDSACGKGFISAAQCEFAKEYIADPIGSMADFLKRNPDYIERSLRGDRASREAAQLCVKNNYYKINE